jgi:hypothetical protein
MTEIPTRTIKHRYVNGHWVPTPGEGGPGRDVVSPMLGTLPPDERGRYAQPLKEDTHEHYAGEYSYEARYNQNTDKYDVHETKHSDGSTKVVDSGFRNQSSADERAQNLASRPRGLLGKDLSGVISNTASNMSIDPGMATTATLSPSGATTSGDASLVLPQTSGVSTRTETQPTIEVPISQSDAKKILGSKYDDNGAGEHGFDTSTITSLPLPQRIQFEAWAYGNEYGSAASAADIATELNSRGKDQDFQDQLEEYAHGNEQQIQQAIAQLVQAGQLRAVNLGTAQPGYLPPEGWVPSQPQMKAYKARQQMRKMRSFARKLVLQKTWEEWDANHRGQDVNHVSQDLDSAGYHSSGSPRPSTQPGASTAQDFVHPSGNSVTVHSDSSGKMVASEGHAGAAGAAALAGGAGGLGAVMGMAGGRGGQNLNTQQAQAMGQLMQQQGQQGLGGRPVINPATGAAAIPAMAAVKPVYSAVDPQSGAGTSRTTTAQNPIRNYSTTTSVSGAQHGHGGGHTTTTHTTHTGGRKSLAQQDLVKKFASRLVKHGEVPPEPPTHQANPANPTPQGGVGGVFGQTTPSAQQAAGQTPGIQAPSVGPAHPVSPTPSLPQSPQPSGTGGAPTNIAAGAPGGGAHTTLGIPFHPGATVSFQYKPPGVTVPQGAMPLPGQTTAQPKPPSMPGGPIGVPGQHASIPSDTATIAGAGKSPNPPTGQYPPNPTPGQGPTDARTGAIMPKLQAQGDPSAVYGVARSMPQKMEDATSVPFPSKPPSQQQQPPQQQNDTNKLPPFAPQSKAPDPNSVNGEDVSGGQSVTSPQAQGSQTPNPMSAPPPMGMRPNPQPGTPVGQQSATMPGMDRTIVGDKWQPTTGQMPGAYLTGGVISSQNNPIMAAGQQPDPTVPHPASAPTLAGAEMSGTDPSILQQQQAQMAGAGQIPQAGTTPGNPTGQQVQGTPASPDPMYANPANPTPQITPATPQTPAPQAQGQQGMDKIQPTPDHQAMLDQKLGQAGFALRQPLAGGNRTYQHVQTGDWAEATPKTDGSGAVNVNFHDRTGRAGQSVDSFSALDQHLANFGAKNATKSFAQTLIAIQKAKSEWIGKPIGPYSSWADCKKAGKSDKYCGFLYHHASPHAKDESPFPSKNAPEGGVPGKNKTMPSDFTTEGYVNPKDWQESQKNVKSQSIQKQQGAGLPPKDWFDRCTAGVSASGSADDPDAVCGNLWANVMHDEDYKSMDPIVLVKFLYKYNKRMLLTKDYSPSFTKEEEAYFEELCKYEEDEAKVGGYTPPKPAKDYGSKQKSVLGKVYAKCRSGQDSASQANKAKCARIAHNAAQGAN